MVIESDILERNIDDPRVQTLARTKKCIVCLTHARHLSPENPLCKEHIIPKQACLDHNLVLGSLQEQWFNIARICRDDHDTVERLKNYGDKSDLLTLITRIANYPRSPDPRLFDLQYVQWRTLFTNIRNNISRLNGSTPPHFESLYSKTGFTIDNILYEWGKGDFDLLIPT